jgi:predicted phosphodiesterase
MKIRLLSDLHLEFMGKRWPFFIQDCLAQGGSDVLVLAGDIAGHDQIEAVLTEFCLMWKHVIYVAGNHEYYSSSPTKTEASIARAVARNQNLRRLCT